MQLVRQINSVLIKFLKPPKRRSEQFITLLRVALPHMFSSAVLVAVYLNLEYWLPSTISPPELEASIQLLTQVLSVVVAVLLLGTTISIASYDGAEVLANLHSTLTAITEPLFTKYFSSGSARHKLDRPEFRNWLLLRPRVELLRFSEPNAKDFGDRWYTLRPHWDGAWYRISDSPFDSSSLPPAQLHQVQRLHEVYLCAHVVLNAVANLRASCGTLLDKNCGTNGTRWFLDDFEKYRVPGKNVVPASIDLRDAVRHVSLALQSEHYMQEELQDHAENLSWTPMALSTFQLIFVDYTRCISQLVDKLQILRWATLDEKHVLRANIDRKRASELLWLEKNAELRQCLNELRGKIVVAHGTARYFDAIKRWSIPGIGLSMLIIVVILCGWPFLKWAASAQTRQLGFMLVYSAGIAALLESSIFLVRVLRKSASRT